MTHSLVSMKITVNYLNCMLAVLVVILFFAVKRTIIHSGLPSVFINVISSAERDLVEYREVFIKSKW